MAASQALGRVPRLAATALLACYIFAAAGSGLDRLSASAPTLERLVPGPLRGQADRSAAAIALARGDMARALDLSVDAVRRDPLEPLSTSLLGAARQLSGETVAAQATFRVAAARGWRDRLTQLYWYDAALGVGDVKNASLRADALLRADPQFAAAGPLLQPLEATAVGRAALAQQLAGNPSWAVTYLKVDGETPDAAVRLKGEIALAASRQGDALGCDNPRPLVTALVERGMRRNAEQLWRAACGADAPAGAAGGIADGGFEQLADGGSASPFGWRKHARGDVFIESVAGAGGGHALKLRNSASVSRIVLSQAVGLAPGSYRVKAKARPTGQVAISLDCGAEPTRPDHVSGDPASGGGQIVEIGACESQVLGVWLRPGAGEVALDDLTIERLR